MTRCKEIILLILINYFCGVKCAKILGIFPMVGGSHFAMSSALMRGLAEAGHDITVISPHGNSVPPTTNGSYRSIILDGFTENYHNDMKGLNLFEIEDFNKFTQEAVFQDYMIDKMEKLVRVPGVQRLIHSNETFDAVIIEQFSNDGLKVFAHIFNAHLIVFAPIGPYNFVNRLVSNPTMVSYNPQVVSTFPRPMSFIHRLHNTLLFVYEEIMNHLVFLPRQDQFIQKYFPGAPSVYDLTKNVSLVLLNSHESIWQAIPLVPNAVPIGGYHIKPPKSLPKDLQMFLDEAKEGVIFVSFGSNLKISDMPYSKKKMLVNAFSKLKERVLWKMDEEIPDLPKNVKSAKWLPQRDILAHRNVKLFITHGGLLSITETVCNGVPVLVIPVYGDQGTNGNNAVNAGFGLSVIYHGFTEEKFTAALKEMLSNPRYKENAVTQSKLYYDRPMTPMARAVYWVEFVIKHGGARHLRVDGIYLPWHQYLLLDIIAFLLTIFVLTVLLLKFILKTLFATRISRNKKIKKL